VNAPSDQTGKAWKRIANTRTDHRDFISSSERQQGAKKRKRTRNSGASGPKQNQRQQGLYQHTARASCGRLCSRPREQARETPDDSKDSFSGLTSDWGPTALQWKAAPPPTGFGRGRPGSLDRRPPPLSASSLSVHVPVLPWLFLTVSHPERLGPKEENVDYWLHVRR
jgi:hypothetical protein